MYAAVQKGAVLLVILVQHVRNVNKKLMSRQKIPANTSDKHLTGLFQKRYPGLPTMHFFSFIFLRVEAI